jgi:hypothetical protein
MEFAPYGQDFKTPAAEERKSRRRRLNNCPQDTASVNNSQLTINFFPFFILGQPPGRRGQFFY